MVQHRSTSRGRGKGRRRARDRRSGRPRRLLLGSLVVGALIAGSAAFYQWFAANPSASFAASSRPTASPRPAASPRPTVRPSPPPSTPPPAPPSPTTISIPAKGSGTFVTAQASGKKVGHGANLLRYMVQVEKGIDISPTQAANEIAEILAAPRGWTNNGVSSFQLVSSGPYNLKVKIATPGTTDALCWAGIKQDTGGEYDCEVPNGVVVNLKRWVLGSPTFDGPISDYRALIINHEMGHFLGHQHETCPGPGKLAPVMMQQIKGLKGCIANAWPYDKSGHYISGPPEQ